MTHFKESIKKTFLSIVIFLVAAAVGIPADNMSPEGFWKTIDDETKEVESIVKIWIEKGELKGKIVKIFPKPGEDPDPVCDKCSGKLKNVRIIGMNFMWAFQKEKNKWINGKIVDPDNGKTYHCQLEITDSGKKLVVFGYIKVIFKIGRNQTWIRHETGIEETTGKTTS